MCSLILSTFKKGLIMNLNELLLVFAVSYFLGSLPYGLILVRLIHKIDIRTIGSGNIGATNVLRAGYKYLALITLLSDALKGGVAILLTKYLFAQPFEMYALAGLFAIIGHIFPIWLKFKGGKGVATFFGVILTLNPLIFLVCGMVWLISALIFRYSSLSALLAVLCFPLVSYYINFDLLIFALIIASLIIYKHKENIKRLLDKSETKIVFKK